MRRVTKDCEDAFVSVIMPVYNEAAHIEASVRAVLENDFPAARLEVLIVDGMSSDGTRDVVRELARCDARVKLLDNRKRTVPYALNIGLAASRGDVLIRVDGHAEVAPDYIRRCLEELDAHPECGCVGGAIESVGATATANAISKAMSSPFGVGNARFRLGGTAGYVDTLAFGAYRREVFERVGRFDEDLTRNQDGEFNFRLRRAGYRIWMSPDIRSRYAVRSSLGKLYRQHYQYGYWKVFVNRKQGAVANYRQLVPVAFVLALILLALAAAWVPVARWALVVLLASYSLGAVGFALLKTRRAGLLVRMLAAFALLHIGFGLGYLEGLVRFVILDRRPGVRNAELSR